MPGTCGGTGVPLRFRCGECRRALSGLRRRGGAERGLYFRVTLTGLTRDVGGHRSVRMDRISRQYRCRDCGHVGWSRHVDLRRG